jgi:hypothetical protein
MPCPVCFGGDDPVVRESLNAGIGVLMGVTAVVLGCFARFFVVLARRARFASQVDFDTGFDLPAGRGADPQPRLLPTER